MDDRSVILLPDVTVRAHQPAAHPALEAVDLDHGRRTQTRIGVDLGQLDRRQLGPGSSVPHRYDQLEDPLGIGVLNEVEVDVHESRLKPDLLNDLPGGAGQFEPPGLCQVERSERSGHVDLADLAVREPDARVLHAKSSLLAGEPAGDLLDVQPVFADLNAAGHILERDRPVLGRGIHALEEESAVQADLAAVLDGNVHRDAAANPSGDRGVGQSGDLGHFELGKLLNHEARRLDSQDDLSAGASRRDLDRERIAVDIECGGGPHVAPLVLPEATRHVLESKRLAHVREGHVHHPAFQLDRRDRADRVPGLRRGLLAQL